jgi:uncharacterized protein YodC (DUF2158 family)
MEMTLKVGDVVTSKATNTPRMTIQGFFQELNSVNFSKEPSEWVLCNYYNHDKGEFIKSKFNVKELIIV